MKSLVRQDPAKAVGKAVRKIRTKVKEYSEDEVFYQKLVAELGTDSALERQLLRVRAEVIGAAMNFSREISYQAYLGIQMMLFLTQITCSMVGKMILVEQIDHVITNGTIGLLKY